MRACVGSLIAIMLLGVVLGGCVLEPPVGEPVYGPPAVVVLAPTYEFHWWAIPHYDVEHHYVIQNDHVTIHDNHYYPGWEQTHRYVHNDAGQHRGWYRHD